MCSTAIMFPGGLCQIREDHIWQSLARWASDSDDRTIKMRCRGGRWETTLIVGNTKHVGSSHLSVADSTAQALTIARFEVDG